MCKLFIVLNKNKEQVDRVNQIIDANKKQFRDEDDGYSVFRKGKKTGFYLGDENYRDYRFEDNTEYRGESLFAIHTRSKTAGEDSINGLHLGVVNKEYVYAHNGSVNSFRDVKNFNDSYFFFKRLTADNKRVTIERINEHIKEYGFTGKGMLYEQETGILHYFCNMQAHMYLFEGMIILSSFEINTTVSLYTSMNTLGYTWRLRSGSQKVEGILKHKKIDNIYFKFKNEEFQEEAYACNQFSTTSGKQITSYGSNDYN